ncbi:hypothetical protein [Demequina sp. NBRC 110053]|uniref:hypothetical protein n=1 Tax=Demequina sp. NBRC 110053 TaxID=1570342 RepID=UPI0011855DA4|nr:hypothetical protein [Demequina sp. NBRC 110053]
MAPSGSRCVRVAWAVALAATAASAAAPAAHAAGESIAISPDGSSYAAQYPGGLFDGVVVVPGAAIDRPFWVRNEGGSDANLAVAIADVTGAAALVEALTVGASAGTSQGAPVTLADVGSCTSLVSGAAVPDGGSLRVDVDLAMADVDGTTAQGEAANFAIVLTLTSDDVAAPDGCSTPTPPGEQPGEGPTPVDPRPTPDGPDRPDGPGSDGSDGTGSGGAGRPSPGVVVVPGFAVGGPDPTPSPSVEPTAEPTAEPTPEPTADPAPDTHEEPAGASLEFNTERFYQEWFVIAWMIELVLGGVAAWWVLRRRGDAGGRS